MKTTLFLFLLCLSSLLFSQTDTVQLIKPTGKYLVGTIIYEWTDHTRNLQLTTNVGDKRRINAQLWYPARIDSNSVIAPYANQSKDYRNVITNSYLRPGFSGLVENSKLIIFSPGRGTERFLYTSIIEELASHGFTVVSVDMPQIGYVIYQDGFIVKPSEKFKPPPGMMGGPYELVDKFFEEPTAIGYKDLEFVFNKILKLNSSDPDGRFTNKINVRSIGIFGHSLGGRIAGKFAADNKNVKAYISMEGIPPRDIRYRGKLQIPVIMLCSSGTWPYAKDNYFSLINNRSHPVFMIELTDFGHNSVTDNPFIYPSSFKYNIDPEEGLMISRLIVLSYFKSALNNDGKFGDGFGDIRQIKFREHK